ncbi:thiopeptide-type bacteriocin biosynthesis protein [Nosocomiicoccus massiliensis]|uniref:Thiopeptide-type bacteriocin biosynthesis protein n=1 Tax=Nosocomiicoccus massiliensis TaxID=1232430 RepID=A0AAF0YNM5_9STAP|nr:thiopeptide-type bacteriocin biosynthesis protein [Nosocomiicoccus massiliensis]WOS95806.1 thiopeptide-type bacteriocin biosynthesis protein [Nosocomiicoccus massiliensis]
MEKSIFNYIYISREPSLNFNKKYLNKEFIDNKEFVDLVNFDNLILRNSKNLSNKIKEGKQTFEINRAISTYLSKLASKPTPFDLNSKIKVYNKFIKKDEFYHIEFSTECLRNIKKDFLKNSHKLYELKVKFNPLFNVNNDRLDFYYLLNNDDAKYIINDNDILKLVRKHCYMNEITLEKLVNLILKKYAELNRDDLLDFLLDLIDKNILVSELDFSNKDTNVVDTISKLSNKLKYKNEPIIKIIKCLKDQQSLSNSFEEIKRIESGLKKIFKNLDNNALVVESYEFCNNHPLEEYEDILMEIINLYLTFGGRVSYIDNKIINWFLEDNEYNLVPLKELINNPQFKEIWSNSVTYTPSKNFSILEDIIECNYFEKTIEISEHIDEGLLNQENEVIGLNGEIVFYIGNRGKVILETNPFSDSFLKISGRFLRNTTEDIRNDVKAKIEEKSCLQESEYLHSELDILTKNPHFNNINKNPSLYGSVINLNTWNDEEENLNIDDLYVGCSNRELYLWSKKHEKKVIPHVSNSASLNDRFPVIYNFLAKMGLEKHRNVTDAFITSSSNRKHTPELTYKGHIILREQWKLDSTFKYQIRQKKIDVKTAFKDWLIRWNIENEYLGLSLGESPMVYNLKNEYHLSTISKIISNNLDRISTIVFINVDSQIHEEDYIFEQFVLGYYNAPLGQDNVKELTNYYHDDRCYSQKWIYIKIYYEETSRKRIYKKIKDFIDENSIQNWHFINYRDPSEHIRIRILPANEKIKSKIIYFIKKLYGEHFIYKYQFEAFNPEINRYGGIENYNNILDYFSISSELAIQRICSNDTSLEAMTLEIYYILNKHFYFSDNEILELYKEFRKYDYEIYREKKRALKENYTFYEPFYLLDYDFSKIISQIAKKYDSDLIKSIIHMHINRVMGINRNEENKIYCLLANFILSKKYF